MILNAIFLSFWRRSAINNNNGKTQFNNILLKSMNIKKLHNYQNSKSKDKKFYSTACLAAAAGALNTLNNGNTTSSYSYLDETTKIHLFPEESLKYDSYNGVTISLQSVPSETTDNLNKFQNTLKESLQEWRNEGKRGIWIHVPRNFAHVVPTCIELGFNFHQAHNGKLVLTHWLPLEESSRLPIGPTHQIGVGALLFHPITKKMLVVQEKTGPAAKIKLWKMVTGLVEPKEEIHQAVIREMKEETGLDCVFEEIMVFRETFTPRGHSDLFFICLVKLQNPQALPKMQPQKEEIADIKWMDVDEFCNQSHWRDSPLYREMNSVAQKALKEYDDDNSSNKNAKGFVKKTLPVGFRPGSSTIYKS